MFVTAYAVSDFIVGLTNVSIFITRPTLWNYTLCGQYPGNVPPGTTVSVYCQENLPPFRYVIVQFPLVKDRLNVCEIEVYAEGDTTYYCHVNINNRYWLQRNNVVTSQRLLLPPSGSVMAWAKCYVAYFAALYHLVCTQRKCIRT